MTWARTGVQLTKYSFLITLCLLPFSISYIWREPFAVSYINLLSALTILLGTICILSKQLKLVLPESQSLLVVFVLMLLMLTIGTVVSDDYRSALGPWTSRFVQPLLLGYVGYLMLANGKVSLKEVSSALWLSLAAIAAHGLLQQFGVLDSNNVTRITGFYFFPNSFARYLMFLLLVLLPQLLVQKMQLMYWIVWITGLVVLLLTQSYAGIGAFVIAAFVMVILLPKAFKSTKIIIALSLLAITSAAFTFRDQLPKYEATISTSLETRQQFWQVARILVAENSLTGIGLEGWEAKYYPKSLEVLEVAPIETVSAQPHNIYLDGALRGGIVGLIAVVGLMIWPILRFCRYKQYRNHWLALGGLGLAVSLLLFGIVDDPIFSDDAISIIFVIYFLLTFLNKEMAPSTVDGATA